MTDYNGWGVEGSIDFSGGATATWRETALELATDWEGLHTIDWGPVHGSFEVAGYERRTFGEGPVRGGYEVRVGVSDLANAVNGDVTIPGSTRYFVETGNVRGRMTVSTNEVVQLGPVDNHFEAMRVATRNQLAA